MQKDLATLRHEAKSLTKALNRESDPVASRHLAKAATAAKQALRRASQNESYEVPMRTPWGRMATPSNYYEELGK